MLPYKTLLSMVMLSITLAVVESQMCPDLYLRYTTEHTFCKPPNRTCTILKRGVSEKDKQFILQHHNDYRNKIAMGQEKRAGGMPQAANMLELIWDDELAATAQKLTETCYFDHDCDNCRRSTKFDVGQNIGVAKFAGTYRGNSNWAWFLDGLYNEIQSPVFNKRIVKSYVEGPHDQQNQYGHLTQLIWADSWTVGCGWSLHTDGPKVHSYYACNYGPGGNVETEEMYKEGPPGSACPPNSCFGNACKSKGKTAKYSGLCKIVNENDAPEGKGGSPDNIFFCSFHDQPDCKYTVTGRPGWTVTKGRGGNWIGIVLNGGQSSTLNFNKAFKTPNGKICFRFLVRRGANRAGQAFGSNGKSSFTEDGDPPMDFTMNRPRRLDYLDFIPTSYSAGMFDGNIKYSFTFSVPPGLPAQYLEIKEISVKPGSCRK